jgi:hypothetical protein
LNSSKQPQKPVWMSPEKMMDIARESSVSPQLVTTQRNARPLARSFTVSVFPVPAGPAGAPPRKKVSAVVNVMTHLSVSGVITSLPLRP